ncbi:MAG TPA: triose-phosphate isomerase [Dehalococcoidia bacterium]|nr:triose-phosphate isomerase [Dehalococcoidia bacterium]
MRIPLIAGNWKMNTTVDEAVRLMKEMLPGLDAIDNIEKLVCPPFVSLHSMHEILKDSSVKLGAQNLHYMEKGAYTGEISPIMLAGICEYVIIGHSERRQYFGDTNEVVNKKIQAAFDAGLKPILCIGESLEENETGKTKEVVTGQLRQSLAGIDYPGSFVIAYEPVWAIGTGKAATGMQANNTIGLVRRTIADLWSAGSGDDVRILYGGSVTAANTIEFLSQPDIDGALVGGASLKPDEFVSIARQTAEII